VSLAPIFEPTLSQATLRPEYFLINLTNGRNQSFFQFLSRSLGEMAFLFGAKKTKHPIELVKQTRDALATMEKSKGSSKNADKANDLISQNLSQMKHILTLDAQTDQQNPEVAQMFTEVFSCDMIILLIQHLADFEFETKKDTVSVFNYFLRKPATVEYICKNTSVLDELVVGYAFLLCFPSLPFPSLHFTTSLLSLSLFYFFFLLFCSLILILSFLFDSYEEPDIALSCGAMLRECIRQDALAKIVLHSELFFNFFKYVEISNFDTASDAFSTFKDLLTVQKQLAAEFLEKNYERVFYFFLSFFS
jgi:calcium binding protein 39